MIKTALDLAILLILPLAFGGTVPIIARELTAEPHWSGRRPTPLFPIAALARLAALLVAVALTPALAGGAPASFPFDFLALAGMLALARAARALAVFDLAGARTASDRTPLLASPRDGAGALLLVAFCTLARLSGQVTLDGLCEAPWLARGFVTAALLTLAGTGRPAPARELEGVNGAEAAMLAYSEALERGLLAALAARLVFDYRTGGLAVAVIPAAALTSALILAFCWILTFFGKKRLF